MLNPNIKEIESLIRLMNDNDFDTIIKWIDRSWIAQAGICARDITDKVRMEQGKFLELEDLRKYFNREKLEKALEVSKKAKT